MIRLGTFCSLLCMFLVDPSASLYAQVNPKTSKESIESSSDPRVRRANREKAVAKIGPEARDFVEIYGDEAVAAIVACSKSTSAKLIEFHASGDMARLPRPRDLLRVITDPRHRDDVAIWAIEHSQELIDPDSFDAYLSHPLEYAMGLKQLKAGAAEMQTNRLNPPEPTTPVATTKLMARWDSLTSDDRTGLTACICLVILLCVALWRKRQSSTF